MSIRNKASLRAFAVIVAALSVLVVVAPPRAASPAQASNGAMDAMSIDMNTSGNGAGAIGTLDQCARIQKDGTQNYDEDFIDGLFIDITAQNIPAYSDNGTPADPADDTGGMTGYQYTLNYPSSQFTVAGQEATTPAVNILAANDANPANSILIGSEPVPDDNLNNRWDSAALDFGTETPESGSGVLDRLTITAEAGASVGQSLLNLTDNGHADASGTGYVPDTTNIANIAVNQACGTLVTSYGYYHPVTPARILDTRTGPPFPAPGALGPNSEMTVDVTGVGTVPATGVSAVVVNATVTGPTQSSFLTIWPSDEPRPTASNLNFSAGQTVPNLVTVKVGFDGNVKVYNAVGSTHVIFDVVGWYGGPTGGSRFNPLPPKRILDTRDGTGAPAAKIGPNSTITVDVTNTYGSGVPNGATAVVVNTTVTEPTAGSYLTVYPADAPAKPLASNLNFSAGQTVPNLVIVKVSADGSNVKIYNAVGSTHVIFDVVGWYGASSGDVFNPLTPARILDTRTGTGGFTGKIGTGTPNGQTIAVQARGAGGVPPLGPTAVIVNATVTEPTQPSYLTVYPSDVASAPLASNLNFVGGQTVPNLVMVKVGAGDGKVKAFNAVGQTHVIFDVVGYFGPVP